MWLRDEDGLSTPRPDVLVRRLGRSDEPAIARLLEGDRGFALFIRSNVLSFGFSSGIEYWGQLARDTTQGDLEGLLMIVGNSAALYAPAAMDSMITPLAEILLHRKVRFIMGRADLMQVVASVLTKAPERIEQHYFADLPTQRFDRALPQPLSGVSVRRATTNDLDGLARLYYGAPGFEHLTIAQIRGTMSGRVTQLRTFVADAAHHLVAAASTSAESYTAGMIGGVWTAPHARGHGYSTAVVAALCADLLRARQRPYLFYLRDNSAAAHIYAKIGFRVIGDWEVIYFEQ